MTQSERIINAAKDSLHFAQLARERLAEVNDRLEALLLAIETRRMAQPPRDPR